jgi:tetratricopeptide (TPR) repeat protein
MTQILRVITVAVSVLWWANCAPSSSLDEQRAASHLDKAKRAAAVRDFDNAIAHYQKALAARPHLAQAHLELALIYDERRADFVSAIYHYRKYIELSPDSPKRKLVEDFIERARLSLAATLPQSGGANADEVSQLLADNLSLARENERLKARIAELERATPRAAAPTPSETVPPVIAPSSSPAPEPPVVAPSATPRRHVVQKGDTLYSLSKRYYGTSQHWLKIYEANRASIPPNYQLRIGQEIVIP